MTDRAMITYLLKWTKSIDSANPHTDSDASHCMAQVSDEMKNLLKDYYGGAVKPPRKGTRVKILKNRHTIAVCENLGEAARFLNLSHSSVKGHLSNGTSTYDGYHFVKLEASK